MPIDRDFLAEHEEVVVDLRPHWIFLFGPLFLTLVALAVAIALAEEFPRAPTGVAWVLVAVVVVPGLWLVGRIVRWSGISLIVTTQRLILRRGILGRDLSQLRLQRVAEVHSTQTPLERLVGAGRLVVEVQGDDQAIAVDDVRRPRSLQRVIGNLLVDLLQGADDPTPPRGLSQADLAAAGAIDYPVARPERGPASVPDQLIQLDDLRRRGILTAQEFEEKKAELLGRL